VFKTIEECRCELVAHTVMKAYTCEVDDPNLGFGREVFLPDDLDASFLPVSAARASFGKEDKTGDNYKADLKLMKFLADNDHVTPFEYNHATFLIEAPLFVLSQIKTHRTLKALDLATNVISRRYTSEDIQFWKPSEWRKQSTDNKQASDGPADSNWLIRFCVPNDNLETRFVDGTRDEAYEASHTMLRSVYAGLLTSGVCREQARAVLPESLITRFYLGGTLRNWAGFIELRTSPNVQEETRVVANRICDQLKELWPDATNSLFANQE
jgi:thymidylate synthase (FAD)